LSEDLGENRVTGIDFGDPLSRACGPGEWVRLGVVYQTVARFMDPSYGVGGAFCLGPDHAEAGQDVMSSKHVEQPASGVIVPIGAVVEGEGHFSRL